MEDDAPGNANVYSVGSLVLSFKNCNHGQARYETEEVIGNGEFEIKRLAGLYNSRCSGGISDDTPSHAKPVKLEVDLESAREDISGQGQAKFWERVDRSDFHVSAEDIPDGDYTIYVCGNPVGPLTVFMGEGHTEFRSPGSANSELLGFDPRNCPIELQDEVSAVLASGEAVLAAKDNGNNGGGNSGDHGNGKTEITAGLENKGIYPDAEAEASYLEKNNSTEFEVEVKGLPEGSYPLWVDNVLRGEISVTQGGDGDQTFKGKLRFSDPQKEQRELLDFDPRGMLIEVYGGTEIIFDTFFPE